MMDMKTSVCLSAKREDDNGVREYQFFLPYGAPLGESYDVCHEMLEELIKMSQKAAERAKQNKEEEAKHDK